MLASARYELRLAALPPDALIAITAGAMRDSAAANRRAEALLAHHSPPPAVATDVLADPDLAPCVLEKTGLRHAAVCKRWSLICAPRGAFARLVETAGDASSELQAAALGELRWLSDDEACGRRVDALVALLQVGDEDEKVDVAATLLLLAGDDDESRVAIAAAGGIEVLVSLARDGTERQKEEAAGALWNLSVNHDNSVAIVAAGGIEVLIALARDGTERQKGGAAVALGNMIEVASGTHEGVVEAGGVAVLSSLTQEAGASDLCKLAAAMSLVYLASSCPDLPADDTCLSLLLSRLDQPEEDGWRRDSINALLALATSSSACAEQWHRVGLGGVAALQALARETAEEGVERQAERCDEALVSLGVRRVRRRTAA